MSESEAFNLFCRKHEPTLCCAVSQDLPVPSFIQGETWEFAGTITHEDQEPPGFHTEAADEAARLTGYYLFQALPAGVVALREGWPAPLVRSLTGSDAICV